MISFGSNTKVYLATGPTDMRKAVNGLMVLVQDVLQADPFSSHLFVFCNQLSSRVEISMETCSPAPGHQNRCFSRRR